MPNTMYTVISFGVVLFCEKKKEKEEAPSAFQSCSGFSLVKYINILSLNNTRMIVVVVYCISVMENELHALL